MAQCPPQAAEVWREKRETGGRRASPESSRPVTGVANVAEITTPALDLPTTDVTVTDHTTGQFP